MRDDRDGERAATIAPVGEQFVEGARVDHGPGQDMRADLGALFKDADGDFAPSLGTKLLQAEGGGKPGRAGADDHNVISHRLAFAHASLLAPLGGPVTAATY